MTQHAFVTVFFEDEIEMLKLQARSMAKFLPNELVGEIIFIDNCSSEMTNIFLNSVTSELGQHSYKARFVKASAIAKIPEHTSGWHSQQILKLKIAEIVKFQRFVILDSKSFFIRELGINFLQNNCGRPTINVYSYLKHPLKNSLNSTLEFFSIYDEKYISRFTATVPPFIFDRELVLSCISQIEEISGVDFVEAFINNNLTEFFSYSASIIRSGKSIEDIYDCHQRFCQIVWEHLSSEKDLTGAIIKSYADKNPLFAVHRLAYSKFGTAEIAALSKFFVECGLFDNIADASNVILNIRKNIFVRQRRRRIEKITKKIVRFFPKTT